MRNMINSTKDGYKAILSIIVCILCSVNVYAGKSETKYLNVGDQFTVYTTYHSYTNSVLWHWDTGVLELVGQVGSASTSATFRVKKASPTAGVVIQATTYYFKSNTTSSGLNKDLDTWHVYATDNSTVSLNSNSETVSPGDNFNLRATPSNSSYSGSYQWASTYSNVAYVSGWGNSVTVVAQSSGNTTIRVTLDNGKYAECYVTVRSVPVSSADISPAAASVSIDGTRSLSLSVYPSNATVNTKSWYSTNTTVATVSSSGVVTGKSEGDTEVYCVVNGSITSSRCFVTVEKPSFTLSSTSPTDNAIGQSVFVQPSATFCRAIFQGTNYSNISLKNSAGQTVNGSCSISGSSISFIPTRPLQANTTYTLSIPANAVNDKYGSYNSAVTIPFTTGDLEKLTLKTSVTDKFLSKGDKITLTASKSSARIYYTLNGSTPTGNSTLYTGPITFENDIKLRAIAVGDGYESSDILSMDYYLTNVEVTGRYPDTDTQLFVYEDVNPSLTFSNRIEPSDNINNVSVLKNAKEAIGGEVIVADSTIYFIPDEPLELGCYYKVSVPQNAIVTWLGEANDATSWTFSTGDFATAIAMGNDVSAAIKPDGSLLTWGEIYQSDNSSNGSYVNQTRTVPETFVTSDVSFVSAGYMHNAIIKTDGSLWMWGRQYCGEFGNNSIQGNASPIRIMDGVAGVSCGGQTSAIVKIDGSLWMVGRNDFGQIGDKTVMARKSPVKIMDDVKSAVAGWCSSYAVKSDGTLLAWGRNDKGQLGDGTTDDRWEPTNIMDDVVIVSTSHTETNTVAAVKSDGSLWVWGNGNPTPHKVLDDVSSVSAGVGYVLAVKNDETMWKWAVGSTKKIAESIIDVKTNGENLLALKKDGSVWTGTASNLDEKKVDGRNSSVLAGVNLNRNTIRMAEGSRTLLVAKPTTLNADYSNLSWNCNNANVLIVSERGVLTANAIGEADVTVRMADSKGRTYTATCHVSVVDPKDLDRVQLTGDANNSGEVNVTDITAVVSHIYGQTPSNFNFTAADVNGSGEINVADITGIVSIIYGGNSSGSRGAARQQVNEVALALPTLTANAGTHVRVPVYIDHANAVSAFQFDLALPENILVSDVECNPDERQCVGAYMADGRFRIVSYSLRNENFVNVSAPVGYINLSVDALAAPGVYKLSLSSAVTSSTGNEFKTNVANGTLIVSSPTGIDNIDNEGSNTRKVTTLGGARMNSNAKLPKGVYIVNGKKQVVR